jgi:hypothetical protein
VKCLLTLVHNGSVTCLIHKGMYMEPYGYAPAPHTLGLWWHMTRLTTFTLVVDDFGVKYTSLANANHLVSALKDKYKIKEDRTGSLYTGLTIDWDYDKASMKKH